MTRIVLVRHGQTAWNKDRIFRGTADVPLNDQGRKEAACAAQWLKDETFHAAYCSPLSRTVETAEIILKPHGISPQHHSGFLDLNYGDWQGTSLEEVKKRYPDLYRRWEQEPQTVTFPNGESLDAVRQRAESGAREIALNHDGQTVLVAAHRVVNKVLIAALLGLDNSHFWEIGQDTAALNEFVFRNDRWICRLINDTCHLRGLRHRIAMDF